MPIYGKPINYCKYKAFKQFAFMKYNKVYVTEYDPESDLQTDRTSSTIGKRKGVQDVKEIRSGIQIGGM